ncbi:MAG: alanine dehydrogenase [Chlamydiota bacterium]
MKIGIPKEVKNHEYRVGLTPEAVRMFTKAHHEVFVEKGAGVAIGFTDALYEKAGAKILATKEEVYATAEMIIKVKEPQPEEYPLLRKGQVLFSYLHLAADPKLAEALVRQNVVALAYETVTDEQGRLPLLVPMSEMAGRIALQAGANALHIASGGRGVLLGGIPGVLPGKVVVIGGGVVGTNAASMAIGLGADVIILDRSLPRLRELNAHFGSRLRTVFSTQQHLEHVIQEADLVIGAVLLPGKAAPKLITKEMLGMMKGGSVIVDVAIDQGGCAATSKPTTHSKPTFVEQGIVHYCVTNMPAACSRTATFGLSNAISPVGLYIANVGYREAILSDPHLQKGLNVCYGQVTNADVAAELGYDYVPPRETL